MDVKLLAWPCAIPGQVPAQAEHSAIYSEGNGLHGFPSSELLDDGCFLPPKPCSINMMVLAEKKLCPE